MNFPEVQTMGGATGLPPTHTPTTIPTGSTLPPVPPPMPSPPEATSYMGFQSAPGLASPPPVSHPSLASMWGIGGFTTPPMPPPPPVVCPNTIASTLGIPQMPNVTYFNSRAPMGFNFRMAGSLNGLPYVFKRKPEEEPEEIKPVTKQHISEERMTAHLNSLHLSESYCNHRLGKDKLLKKNVEAGAMGGGMEELEDDEDEGLGGDKGVMALDGSPSNKAQGPRLVIADEVKHIVPGDSKLPDSILKKLTQPSMEVVLWQPPPNILSTVMPANINTQMKTYDTTATTTNTTATSSLSHSNTSSTTTTASTSTSSASSASSSPDSGISITSPPLLADSYLGHNSTTIASAGASGFSGPSDGACGFSPPSSEVGLDLLSLPSTSSGSRGCGFLPSLPLRRPASPLPDHMIDDDYSERMEFNNNNNGSAPNFMWLEENNNTALMDLNAIEPQRAAGPIQPPLPEDLPDFPDDDMDL